MKLHLGCGTNILEGFLNVDVVAQDPKVFESDVRNLENIAAEGTVSEIYACHVLEHVPRAFQIQVLQHWCSRLKPGGVCRISVPDFNYLINQYLQALVAGEPWWEKVIIEPLFGGYSDGHEDEHNHHHLPYDFSFLKYLMQQAGFVGIRRSSANEIGFIPNDWSTWPLSLNVVGYKSTTI